MAVRFKLEKKEILFFLVGVSIILFWFLFAKDLITPFLYKLPSFLAMIIYRLGFLIGLLFMSAILDSWKVKIKFSIISVIIILIIHLIDAPYLVTTSGTLITTPELSHVDPDIGFGSLYSVFFSGKVIWYLVYIFTPIILTLLAIIIATPKTIKKFLSS